MPVIYTPSTLRSRSVPDIRTLRATVPMISDALSAMERAGDIVGATSYGSLFHENALLTCASDIDWLVVFCSSEHMLRSAHWRTLLVELDRRNIHFHVPVLSLENIKTGNHTLSSLLHGIRYTERRIITGKDPLQIFERHGWQQNSLLTTLQLFGSYTRFFFETYAYDFHSYHRPSDYTVLSHAISIWKDILSSMIVACIPPHTTTEVSWQKYAIMYANTFPASVIESGRKVFLFLEDLRQRMLEYSKLLEEPLWDVQVENFCADHALFLEAAEEIVPAAAHFAEANITLYRDWAHAVRMDQIQSGTSQEKSYAYNATSFTPILYGSRRNILYSNSHL